MRLHAGNLPERRLGHFDGLPTILKVERSQGGQQSLYIALRGLSEEALVLPIELAWACVSHREGCICSIEFLCEHLLPCCVEPKLLLKLNRTHCCETTEVMMQS